MHCGLPEHMLVSVEQVDGHSGTTRYGGPGQIQTPQFTWQLSIDGSHVRIEQGYAWMGAWDEMCPHCFIEFDIKKCTGSVSSGEVVLSFDKYHADASIDDHTKRTLDQNQSYRTITLKFSDNCRLAELRGPFRGIRFVTESYDQPAVGRFARVANVVIQPANACSPDPKSAKRGSPTESQRGRLTDTGNQGGPGGALSVQFQDAAKYQEICETQRSGSACLSAARLYSDNQPALACSLFRSACMFGERTACREFRDSQCSFD